MLRIPNEERFYRVCVTVVIHIFDLTLDRDIKKAPYGGGRNSKNITPFLTFNFPLVFSRAGVQVIIPPST